VVLAGIKFLGSGHQHPKEPWLRNP
jgi:hypothetical protein